ncbi:MAG: hypothetical protein IPN20_14985 [Haliscomenobacter sp.]|nr:hypothetical protein [Haliscomenobacter sp.]
MFNRLFAIRQQADYEDFADIHPEEIQPLLSKINDLIQDIEQLIFRKRPLGWKSNTSHTPEFAGVQIAWEIHQEEGFSVGRLRGDDEKRVASIRMA